VIEPAARPMDEHGPDCPQCGYCCMEDHLACPGCGHCGDLHGYDFVYCQWVSPSGIFCPCTRERTTVIEARIELWPDEEDES
jgi:hypothetical protein